MEEERGLTIGEIFKIIFRRIWWVVGATALCLIITVLVTQLWYNKSRQYYSVSYEVVFPEIASGKYPDNSDVLYSDCISYTTLTAIKNGTGMYAKSNLEEYGSLDFGDGESEKIDVDKMLRNDGISISEVKDGTHKTYTLTAKAQYFSDSAQASKFLRAVAYYPVLNVNRILTERNYEPYLSLYTDAGTYEDKITALLNQKNYIENSYETLMNYAKEVEVNYAALHNVFTQSQRETLAAKIAANHYVYNPDLYEKNANERKLALELQIKENEEIIKSLQIEKNKQSTAAVFSGARDAEDKDLIATNAYDYEIARLVVKNGEIQNEVRKITDTLEAIKSYKTEGSANYDNWRAFEESLRGYRLQLEEATQTLKSVSAEVYKNNSRVVFAGNRMQKMGGIGTITSAVLGALVGLLVSSIVVCIVDVPKYKRKLAAQSQPSADAVEEAEADGQEEK